MTLLDGKVAIVTGGGGGIGRGIVERFVGEGASVVFAEIDADRARATQVAVGERCVGVVCDVRASDSPTALVTAARDNFGRVDVLVNNVGHYGGKRKAFHEQTDEEWDELHQVNLGHVLTHTRAVLPVLLPMPGRIGYLMVGAVMVAALVSYATGVRTDEAITRR